MPVSIKMYRLNEFANSFPVSSVPVNPGYGEVSFTTSVERLGRSEYTEVELDKYQVTHISGEEFVGHGYLEDGSLHDIVAVSKTERFNLFVEQDKDFLYAQGTRRIVSEQAIKRLRRYSQAENRLLAEPIKINLIALKEFLQNNSSGLIKGGWFRNMQIANVEVAYLGGGSVTESDDWEKYETSGGSISALRIDLPTIDPDEEAIKILLTRDGNCVVYKNYNELDLLTISIPFLQSAKDFIE